MYLFGEDAPNRFGDFRPEVHDSDGVSSWSSTGEWLFRPLRNPPRTVTTSFRLDAPTNPIPQVLSLSQILFVAKQMPSLLRGITALRQNGRISIR